MSKLSKQIFKADRQRGSATLVVALILLIVTSMITLYGARSSLMEQRISSNDYRASRLAEVADAGIDHGIAWLATNSNNVAWLVETAAPYNVGYERSQNTLSADLGSDHGASVFFRRPTDDSRRMQVVSTANEKDADGNPTGVARTSTTEVIMKMLVAKQPVTALTVDGCMSNIVGTPSASNIDMVDGPLIATSQDLSSTPGCIDTGHLNNKVGDQPLTANSYIDEAFPAGTLWDTTFGITKAEMQAMAAVQAASIPSVADRTIIWYNGTTKWQTNVGSATKPAILVISNCAALGAVIYGIVYYEGTCSDQGWGNSTVYGSIIGDGSILKLNANADIEFSKAYLDPLKNQSFGVSARVPGSWMDDNV